MSSKAILSFAIMALVLIVALPGQLEAKKWDIAADSVELTTEDIDRPYEIKEIVSLTLRGDVAEKLAEDARGQLRKAAADRGCDAVILVDHFTERDVTELFTNAVLVQTLTDEEVKERRKTLKSPEEVRKMVDAKEILLSEKGIDFPFEVKKIADVIPPDGSASSMTTVDGLLSDAARKARGHAVIFIKYDRGGTQVNGAKGLIVKFPRKWLKEGELPPNW